MTFSVDNPIRRAAREAIYKTRYLVDPGNIARWKYTVLFPIRNVLSGRKAVPVTAGGENFLLVPEGAVAGYTWSRLLFEKHELEFILGILEPGMTFFDVGANVGIFSIPAAKKVKSGKVYSFEPCQWTYERLLRNIKLNHVDNILPMRTAVGDAVGQSILKLNAPGKDGLNTIGNPSHSMCDIVGEETVPITTLDEFIRISNISNVDVMKIDIEGAELLLFRGAENLLKREDAPLILYECGCTTKGFGYNPIETMWFLEKCGYSLFVLNTESGEVSFPELFRGHDVMALAIKPHHRLYSKLWRVRN